jgi:hypothetical protein
MTDPAAPVQGTSQAADQAAVLMGLVRLAGPSGVSTAQLKTGCLLVRNQEPLLQRMEASGAVRSEGCLLPFAGRRWVAVEVAP